SKGHEPRGRRLRLCRPLTQKQITEIEAHGVERRNLLEKEGHPPEEPGGIERRWMLWRVRKEQQPHRAEDREDQIEVPVRDDRPWPGTIEDEERPSEETKLWAPEPCGRDPANEEGAQQHQQQIHRFGGQRDPLWRQHPKERDPER